MASRINMIVADDAAHAFIRSAEPRAYEVASFSGSRSARTWAKLAPALQSGGYVGESVFDAAHGSRYMLFVYKTPEERAACYATLGG